MKHTKTIAFYEHILVRLEVTELLKLVTMRRPDEE